MNFIIGGRGLVGSAIKRYHEQFNIEYKNIQRENKEEFHGRNCDILFFADGNAYKYKANQDPLFDFIASVSSISEYVHKINYKKFILISTVDVYHDLTSLKTTIENAPIQKDKLHNYGYHKLLGEEYVQNFCKDYLIFRLAGLVGIGLKKNPVYDFIHQEKKVMISKYSKLNFINTDFIVEIIFKVIKLDIKNEIFNLASENSMEIKDIKKILNIDTEYTPDAEKYVQNYEINIKKVSKFIKPGRSEDAILHYYKSLQNLE